MRLRPGETDNRPAVVELEPPSVDSADVPSECPQGRVEPGFNRLAFRRIVHDRSAKHRIPGDFLRHHIEWAGCDHRDESRRGVDAIGAQRGLRKDPRPGGLASEVGSATLQLCGDVDVSYPRAPNRRLWK